MACVRARECAPGGVGGRRPAPQFLVLAHLCGSLGMRGINVILTSHIRSHYAICLSSMVTQRDQTKPLSNEMQALWFSTYQARRLSSQALTGPLRCSATQTVHFTHTLFTLPHASCSLFLSDHIAEQRQSHRGRVRPYTPPPTHTHCIPLCIPLFFVLMNLFLLRDSNNHKS